MSVFGYPTNITNMVDVLRFANTVTDSRLGIFFLIVIGFITMIITSLMSMRETFLITTFVIFVVAILLNLLGLLSSTIVMVCVVLMVVGMIFAAITKSSPGA